MSRTIRHIVLGLTALLLGAIVGGAAAPAHATSTPTTFSGRATAIKGSIPAADPILATALPCKPGGNPSANAQFCIADTGAVGASGGALDESLLCYPSGNGCTITSPVGDPTGGVVKARVLSAAVVSQGNMSSARASAADAQLAVGGVAISADFLEARARAKCSNGTASVSGDATVAKLTVNGYTVDLGASTAPNTDIVGLLPPAIALTLPAGTQIIVNEQPSGNGASGGSGAIDVNALHVIVPGVADVVVGAAHADITCGQLLGCPGPHAFVTGGGFFDNTIAGEPKAHFAVAGRNGVAWGHVLYKPTGLHVQKPYAIVYGKLADLQADSANTAPFDHAVISSLDPRQFEGAAIVYWTNDGTATGTKIGEALAVDMGEPGRGDYFEIAGLDAMGKSLVSLGGGFLQGGNIQMHGKC